MTVSYILQNIDIYFKYNLNRVWCPEFTITSKKCPRDILIFENGDKINF